MSLQKPPKLLIKDQHRRVHFTAGKQESFQNSKYTNWSKLLSAGLCPWGEVNKILQNDAQVAPSVILKKSHLYNEYIPKPIFMTWKVYLSSKIDFFFSLISSIVKGGRGSLKWWISARKLHFSSEAPLAGFSVFAAVKGSGREEPLCWGGCSNPHAANCNQLFQAPSTRNHLRLKRAEAASELHPAECVRSRHLHVLASRWCSLAHWAAAGRHLSLLLHPAIPSRLSLCLLAQPQLVNVVWVCQLSLQSAGPGWDTCSAAWKQQGRSLWCVSLQALHQVN